ncbi:MAG: hypothetical protein HRT87_05415 [Legionellales bacterium]|nr:hypothetical protein [Legionellales bacterium]
MKLGCFFRKKCGCKNKFVDMVNRAMFRVVMEYVSDNLVRASRILGIDRSVLPVQLTKYFGGVRVCKKEAC